MKQEHKELLLKDLSARVPYGVKVEAKVPVNRTDYKEFIDKVTSVSYNIDIVQVGNTDVIVGYEPHFEIKPYLFPLSSMTEEQRYDFYCRFIENEIDYNDFKEFYFENNMWHKMLTSIDDCDSVVDWFNKYHFDYRGLIPMGLAKDATNSIVY